MQAISLVKYGCPHLQPIILTVEVDVVPEEVETIITLPSPVVVARA